MAYTITQVRPLLSTPELALFEHSRAEAVKALTAAQLRQKVTRARTLRDKYRDLYRRQTVQSRRERAGGSAAGPDNQRTGQKAEIFAQALGRFESQLFKAESRTQRTRSLTQAVREALAARQDADASGPMPSARPRAAGHPPASVSAVARGVAPTDAPALAERKNVLKAEPSNLKIQASAGARNRRAQARRDSR